MKISLFAALLLGGGVASAESGRAERRAGYKLWDAGVALVLAGEEDKAKEAWEKCLRIDSGNADCRAGLKLLGSKPAAAAKAGVSVPPRAASESKPVEVRHADPAAARASVEPKRRAVAHWNAGIISFQQGDYPKALGEWRLCAALDKMNADCRTGIDRVEGRLALPKQPRPAPAAAVKNPKDARVQKAFGHWNAGILYYQKGELEKARKEWTLCRSSDPTNMDCHTGLLRIARQYGEK